MKTFTKTEQIVEVLHNIQCDRCKRRDNDIMEMQEYYSLNQDVGYGGILGDGNIVRLDLCQYCFKELFEGIYRIEGNYIWGNLIPGVDPTGAND
jgi:hypothetical protein